MTPRSPVNEIDPLGLDAIVVLNPTAVNLPFVGPQGHMAILIGDDQNGWYLYSRNGGPPPSNDNGTYYLNMQLLHNARPGYQQAYRIPTTLAQDARMKQSAADNVNISFDGLRNNCADLVQSTMRAGGLSAPDARGPITHAQIPKAFFPIIESANPDRVIPLFQ